VGGERRGRSRAAVALLAVAIVLDAAVAHIVEAQGTDITVDYDKTFTFTGLTTWAWHPDGRGDVRLALTPDDDPDRVASRVNPVIVPAVEREMLARGFRLTDGQPDVYVHYFALVTIKQMEQSVGQFVPAVPAWGLPPFPASTTALEVYPVGTLILDISSAGEIVWRGAAKRKIDFERPEGERRAVLERAIRDLLRRFPPRR
jgi:hypothetical protein